MDMLRQTIAAKRERLDKLVGQSGVAIPAVLGARPVDHFASVGRSVSRVEKIFHAIDGIVQEVGVVGTHVDVNLALQLGAQLRPIPLQNPLQVVVLAPVCGHSVIDLARHLVKDRLRIAVRAHRPVDCLPDVELLAAAAMIAQGQFVGVDRLGGDPRLGALAARVERTGGRAIPEMSGVEP